MKGILILAHGSKAKETEATLDFIVEIVKQKNPDKIIEFAFLQMSEKTLNVGLDNLIELGVNDIKVVPYFLFEGLHIKEDIPNEIKTYCKSRGDINVEIGKTLGCDLRLADILNDRINEIY